MPKVELVLNRSFHYCEQCQNSLGTYDVFLDDEHVGSVDLSEELSGDVENLIGQILERVLEGKE